MPYPYIILYATPGEVAAALESTQVDQKSIFSGRSRISGTLHGKPVRLVETGIGLVNTAQALTEEISHEFATLVIQVGIAGVYPSAQLGLGAVAIASTEIDGETGLRYAGSWQPSNTIGIPLIPGKPNIYNRIDLDIGIASRAAAACEGVVGTFVTVAGVTADPESAAMLETRFSPLCESMEGSAAAQVCRLYNTPFLEIRGISNIVGDRNKARWKIREAAAAAQEALASILPQVESILGGTTTS